MAGLTLKYTFTGTLPDDLSTTFSSITQIPHVRCFGFGKYVILSSDEKYLEEHSSPAVTRTLKDRGFHLVESQESQ